MFDSSSLYVLRLRYAVVLDETMLELCFTAEEVPFSTIAESANFTFAESAFFTFAESALFTFVVSA